MSTNECIPNVFIRYYDGSTLVEEQLYINLPYPLLSVGDEINNPHSGLRLQVKRRIFETTDCDVPVKIILECDNIY